ncbi:MAG: general secretion pathway protein GspC [Deltaproteobacteria bacterium]|nr:general secretion pathway protein GspC [Deltaproteobacteria bacterium]
MDTWLRKYFWTFELAAITACAFFVSSIANAYIGASLRPLPELPKTEAATGGGGHRQASPPNLDGVKDKNIFGTARQAPINIDTTIPVDDSRPEDFEPTLSQIKAKLVGTVVAEDPQWSLCVLVETGTQATGIYGVGSVVQDDYFITKIERKRVTLTHSNRFEYLDLEEEHGAPRPALPISKKVEEPASGEGVRKLTDTSYVVSQAEIDKTLSNLNQVAMQARIVPNFEGGKANGFKLFSIKPDSIYSKIGLQNGDVVQKINGFEMNSPDKALEIYQKLKDSKSVKIDISRGGKAMSYDYTIH